MNEQGNGDYLDSSRELDSFELNIQTARSKADVADVLLGHNLSKERFIDDFPDLAKLVQDLLDEPFPST
jgi:hypothetical protein